MLIAQRDLLTRCFSPAFRLLLFPLKRTQRVHGCGRFLTARLNPFFSRADLRRDTPAGVRGEFLRAFLWCSVAREQAKKHTSCICVTQIANRYAFINIEHSKLEAPNSHRIFYIEDPARQTLLRSDACTSKCSTMLVRVVLRNYVFKLNCSLARLF